MKYLKLTLYSPLQYYAKQNQMVQGNHFNTETHPTKPALVGMMGCAMGFERGSEELVDLDQRIDCFYRVERGNCNIVTDFQTAGPLWENQRFSTVDGGTKQGRIIKYVQYIEDTEFSVYLGSEDEELLKNIHSAFLCPVWSPYLGKRGCIPAIPIVPVDFKLEDDIEDVFNCA